MNLGCFSGNLGRDAKTGTAGQNNTPYLSFPLGVSVGFGDNKRTLWVGCTLWGKRAESKLINWLGKGAKVVVSGEIDLDMYTKADQTQGATITVRVRDLELMEGKERTPDATQAPAPKPAPVDDLDDDIPF
jgi:single-strand DNA-binding protein